MTAILIVVGLFVLNTVLVVLLWRRVDAYEPVDVFPAPSVAPPDVRSDALVPEPEPVVEPEPGAVMLLKAVRKFLAVNPDRLVGFDGLAGRVVTVGLVTTRPDGRTACDVLVDRLPVQGVTKIDIRDDQIVFTLSEDRAASVDGFLLPQTDSFAP